MVNRLGPQPALGGFSVYAEGDIFMIHQPEQTNRTPEAAVLALFLCATVSFVSASFDQIAGRGFLQGLGLLFFCAMIYILVRYKFSRIRYIVRPGKKAQSDAEETGAEANGEKGGSALRLPPDKLDFVVEKKQGSRIFSAECVLSLGALVSCIPLPDRRRDRRNITSQYKKAKTYHYLQNMVGAHQCMLVFQSRDMGDIKLMIEPSENMEGYLSAVARYNREKKTQKEKERS